MSNGFLATKDIIHGAITQLANGVVGNATGNIGDLCQKLFLTEDSVKQAFNELVADSIISIDYIESNGRFSIELLKTC